ncbi:MAG: L-seryl-tRNA(Sec) selenium transferase, partial [Chloroflexi bacterium]|nr:L-seryl-tRNA(Sec) selenium transferase [Chloroflexota bacterium]
MASEFRHLPSVDRLLSEERLKELERIYPRGLLVDMARRQLERERQAIAAGRYACSFDELVESIRRELSRLCQPTLRPVINATGVVLHTNLGRAPLSGDAVAAMELASNGYCNLEFDLDSGTRGSRAVHLEPVLCQLTGAEAALVVNNNASAVLLTL